ncbi:N-acetylmuramoyl-L-alanine amidase [bacterium]|nr:MAG: N-acetylmuramoyl-L-alanine amidase [bacterium]
MRAFILVSLALPLACQIASSTALAQDTAPIPPVLQTAPVPSPVDYAGAVWVAAGEGNFQAANRPREQPIDMVIVHDIEGPDTAALSIFQRAGAKVSSHYVVGVDGTIYQMVREHDVAWHAGNGDINRRSVGIETHGYAYRPGFYTPKIYEAEAKLVRDITQRYNIPRDRTHIIGHAEVPNPRDPTRFGGVSGHTDPGPYWDWNTFMALVRNDARVESAEIPTVIRPGEKLPIVVNLQNTGDDAWVANKASNPRIGLQADAPVVYLGTSQGTASEFSSLGGWLAPQYADVVKTTDVAPGASARFEFTLQGPRTLGEINEELRAIRVPTIAQGGTPTPFGASIPLKLNVVPWDMTVPAPDNATAGTTPAGTTTKPQPLAKWTVKLPMGGIWGVFVAPPKPTKVRKKEAFSYSLDGIEGGSNITIDSKDAGQGFVFGGYYRVPEASKNALVVTLDKAPQGMEGMNAGSIRVVGPFPTMPEKMPPVQGAIGEIATSTPQQWG